MTNEQNFKTKETIAIVVTFGIIGAAIVYWGVQIYNAGSMLMMAYG